jgi:hypothetical protein
MCINMLALASGEEESDGVHNTTTISPVSVKTGADSAHQFAALGCIVWRRWRRHTPG